MQVQKLYPQYQAIKDRRQQEIPVDVERRSGMDRRSESRIMLDNNLTRDIFEVKGRVNKLDEINPRFFSQNASTANLNQINKDMFVRETKPQSFEKTEIPKKSDQKVALTAGILACALGGVLAGALLGPAGAIIAVGVGGYLGVRLVQEAIASHMKDTDNKN